MSYHNGFVPTKRVLTVAGVPPEKCAYALARYSRSPDSIRQSLDWVRTHDSQKFLESFYFQYGHASIADLGHVVLCFEGISELAATEAEDEQLWDGQARSSRYQDFARGGFVTPPEFDTAQASTYEAAGRALLDAYRTVHAAVFEHLLGKLRAAGGDEGGRLPSHRPQAVRRVRREAQGRGRRREKALDGLAVALAGQTVNAPEAWAALQGEIAKENNPKLVALVNKLAVSFRDPAAIKRALAAPRTTLPAEARAEAVRQLAALKPTEGVRCS